MKDNYSMMTDFYELTMSSAYLKEKDEDSIAYFDLFFRKYPFEGGYTISGGLDEIINYIKNLKITEEDINYLRSQNKLTEGLLEYLKNFKFTGDIYAVPDGTVVFKNEPVITVRAPIIEAQVIETALLTEFNHGSLVTTAARRIVEAAKGRGVMEFGSRRARGGESATKVAKYAYIGGCIGTSNTLAGKEYDVPVLGTMAHSFVQFYEDEYIAFLKYAKANPDNCVFLIDTYSVLNSGLPNAIKVAREYLIPNGYPFKGVRIDSGDLAYLSKQVRKILDEEGFTNTKICLSNGLKEETITSLIEQGAIFDTLGVGDNIAASKERVEGVYKLVAREIDEEIIPRIKVSEEASKITNPGFKKVYRFYDKDTGYALGDVIAFSDEIINTDSYTLIDPINKWKKTTITNYNIRQLQVPIFINGELVYDIPNIHERKSYSLKDFETIYPEIKRQNNPHDYYVDLSEELLNVKEAMINNQRGFARKRVK